MTASRSPRNGGGDCILISDGTDREMNKTLCLYWKSDETGTERHATPQDDKVTESSPHL